MTDKADKGTTSILTLKIAARALVELLYRRGNLALGDLGCNDALEGIKAHKRCLAWLHNSRQDEGLELFPEYPLSHTVALADLELTISGRADALIKHNDNFTIVEIKSFRSQELLSPEGDELHWAQAKIYAAIQAASCLDNTAAVFGVSIIYASVDEDNFITLERKYSVAELKVFLEDSIHLYLKRIRNFVLWQKRRNEAALRARFPFPDLRAGQKKMMKEVLNVLRQKESLFVQAPTGIGKTMATIYPALKAQAKGYVDQIFYATAMTSTRHVAEEALEQLRASSFIIRSLTLFPKEKNCPNPELYCDLETCPYAQAYYDKLPDALAELLLFEHLSSSSIGLIASKYKLCPFELALDCSQFCDLIIGDYNHVFDPRVRIRRLFENSKNNHALLIDEAHNLPKRAREMYSAVVALSSLGKLKKMYDSNEPVLRRYTKLQQCCLLCLEIIAAASSYTLEQGVAEPSIYSNSRLDPNNNALVSASRSEDWWLRPDFLALKLKPDKLLRQMAKLIFFLRQLLDENKSFNQRRDLLQLFFDLLHFNRIAELYFNQAYYFMLRRQGDDCFLYLFCLDPALPLSNLYKSNNSTVFFSATLTPQAYYETLLDAKAASQPPATLLLDSPFPAHNRLFLISTAHSLLFKQREQTAAAIVNLILAACAHKQGNYLVFVPSYQYLKHVKAQLKAIELPANTEFMFQRPAMGEKQKAFFLHRFDDFSSKTLLAFAVMGSLFNEGIDLKGEKLSGVIILGTALPPPSYERDLMAQYYEAKFGEGNLYAYLYPSFNRIEQAVGRLIRSATDTGFVILIDKRWQEPYYRDLLPRSWHYQFCADDYSLNTKLAEFWDDRKADEDFASN